MKRNRILATAAALLMSLTLLLAGCGLRGGDGAQQTTETIAAQTTAQTETTTTAAAQTEAPASEADAASEIQETSASDGVYAAFTAYEGGVMDGSSIFTTRDLRQDADLSGATAVAAADGQTYEIREAGVYVLSGSAKNFTVKIEADSEDKVQLVLNGLNVENESFPVIYLISADKLFITTAEGSENTLSVTGTFTADGDTNTDAVIFGKDDMVFNGLGALTVVSQTGHGISCKDDLKFTGGTYTITAANHAIEANDSIAVCGGSFTLKAGKDGFHAENDDDNTLGWIYIAEAEIAATGSSDGIQATTVAQIDSGTLNLSGGEGIEGTYIQINGGDITVTASDDGINASQASAAYRAKIEINGGNLNVTVGQGDTDAIDSNGDIIVNGGAIEITAPTSSFDYDGAAQFNGGTIVVNGQQLSQIPQSMMGGGMGGFGGMQPGGNQGGMPGFRR